MGDSGVDWPVPRRAHTPSRTRCWSEGSSRSWTVAPGCPRAPLIGSTGRCGASAQTPELAGEPEAFLWDKPWQLDPPLFSPSSISMGFGKLKSCANNLFSSKRNQSPASWLLADQRVERHRARSDSPLWGLVWTPSFPARSALCHQVCERYRQVFGTVVSPGRANPGQGLCVPASGPLLFRVQPLPEWGAGSLSLQCGPGQAWRRTWAFWKEGEDVCVILASWRVRHQCELETACRLSPQAP